MLDYQDYMGNLFRLSRKHGIPFFAGMNPADYVNSALAIMMAELGLHPAAHEQERIAKQDRRIEALEALALMGALVEATKLPTPDQT